MRRPVCGQTGILDQLEEQITMLTMESADIAQLTQWREEFQENGFLILPGALSPEECDRYIGVLDRLDRTLTTGARGRERKPGDGLELRSCIKKAPEFMELVDRPEILMVLGFLHGYNIQLGNSHAFIRPGFQKADGEAGQRLFGWHRDLMRTTTPVNGRYPHLATRVGYFFTPADEPMMGSLYVVPGSHRVAGRPAWNRQTDLPYGMHELLVTAGSAVFFDNRLWHSTSPNYGPHARKNLYMEYAQRWLRPFDYHFQEDATYDAADPVRKQLLGYSFTDVEDGNVGYCEPHDVDTPLKFWLAERGIEVPGMVAD
ncbi:MAG TPA: phytanoyl-CoA dioxygenase family protein [Mycobacteriales bacterium]|nr:phytanoyl-CoA dioxygenase family protein [Mycobacteriales bacterium]